jgi:O-antigen/teichoic acid export membrane protein
MTSIKKVIKNSAIYSGYAILVKGINFFLLPLYTIYLTTSDYGILSVIESYVGLISIFVTFALGRSATRFYFKYKNNLDDIKELWGSIIVFVLFSSIIVFLALFLFNNIFVSPFLKDVAFFPYVFLGIIPILFNPSFIIYQSSLQIQHMGKQFSLINLLRFGTRLGLILTFVIYFGYGAKGVLLSSAITSIIFFAYTAWFFFPVITLRLKRKKIIESLKFSIPLMPRSIAGWAYGMVDKILLNNIKSSADAGLYSVGFQFGFVINFIVDSVHQAYKPWVFENFEAGEQGIKNISKYICTFVLIYAYLATCLSLFGEEILKVIVSKSF